jgi:hypothetical protein
MQNKHVSIASLIATHIVQKTNTGISLEEKEHNPPSAFGKQASKQAGFRLLKGTCISSNALFKSCSHTYTKQIT